MNGSKLDTLDGKEVVTWIPGEPLESPDETIPRIEVSWDDEAVKWQATFAAFLDEPGLDAITGLVLGPWVFPGEEEDSSFVVEALVASRERFPNLKSLFIGDIISEENEVSWIRNSDVSPLLGAFPSLEYFRVRGGEGLVLGSPHHENLKTLIVEAGGLDARILTGLSHAFLPELTHLELWLGTENYGATSTAEDCVPLLSAELFPKLRYLGLRDSEIQDDIAIVVAKSPFLCQLETLDLSMGTLSDFGAEVLLESLFIPKLKKLDLHHHYCSNEMMALLRRLPCEVDLGEQQKIDPRWRNHRFVAVSE